MLDKLLPNVISTALDKVPMEKLTEIRIRMDKRIILCVASKSYYLSIEGLTSKATSAIVSDKSLVEEVFRRACENSVYAYTEQIKRGFITTKGGVRVGICGEGVVENGCVKTIKNISSLAIRIPHEVKGCALPVMNYLFMGDFQNTLIISPPGCGKTTFIRDIIYELSQKEYCYNVLLVDERFEIAGSENGKNHLDIGSFCDVISGTSKHFAFENALRSMKPDIIVTDELYSQRDFDDVLTISKCGVKVIASVHAKDLEELKSKSEFEKLLQEKTFSRFVILSSRKGVGTVEGVFDRDMRCINY